MGRPSLLFLIKKAHKIKSFLIIGLIAVFVDYIIYSALVVNGFNISFSKSIGFVFGTSFSFVGNRRVTFNSKFSKLILIKYFLLYLLTVNLNVLLNNKLLVLFFSIEFKKNISFLFATAICAAINFFGLNYFVFKK